MRMRDIINLIENAVPEDVVEEYSYGKCMWLALAIHKRFGWPIRVQVADDGSIAHAYNVMPDGREIDILGPQKMVDIFSTNVRDVSPKELRSLMQGESSHDGLEDAEIVLDRYIVPNL